MRVTMSKLRRFTNLTPIQIKHKLEKDDFIAEKKTSWEDLAGWNLYETSAKGWKPCIKSEYESPFLL